MTPTSEQLNSPEWWEENADYREIIEDIKPWQWWTGFAEYTIEGTKWECDTQGGYEGPDAGPIEEVDNIVKSTVKKIVLSRSHGVTTV